MIIDLHLEKLKLDEKKAFAEFKAAKDNWIDARINLSGYELAHEVDKDILKNFTLKLHYPSSIVKINKET